MAGDPRDPPTYGTPPQPSSARRQPGESASEYARRSEFQALRGDYEKFKSTLLGNPEFANDHGTLGRIEEGQREMQASIEALPSTVRDMIATALGNQSTLGYANVTKVVGRFLGAILVIVIAAVIAFYLGINSNHTTPTAPSSPVVTPLPTVRPGPT